MQCSDSSEHPPHSWGDENMQVHFCPGNGWCK
jgi:hypothetical protein